MLQLLTVALHIELWALQFDYESLNIWHRMFDGGLPGNILIFFNPINTSFLAFLSLTPLLLVVALRKLYSSACVFEFFEEAWGFLESFASRR